MECLHLVVNFRRRLRRYVVMDDKKDYLIDRILRFIIAIVLVLSIMFPLGAPHVFAGSTVDITGGDNVKGGKTFTVSVVYGGGNVGRVDAQMLYDTDKLTYISGGTSTGNSGYIQLKTAGTDGAIVFNITFQAISEGSTDVQVTTNEMYSLDETLLNNPSAHKTINISGNAQKDELITEPEDDEQPDDSTERIQIGVDEKEDTVDPPALTTQMMIIIAASIIALIVIILILIMLSSKKKKNKNRMKNSSYKDYNDDYEDIDKW